MIAVLAAAAIVGHSASPLSREGEGSPSFVKIDEPASPQVAFAAVAALPNLGAKDLQLLRIAVRALPDGSDVYTGRTIRQVTDGRGIHCTLLPDSVLVSFEVPKGAFKSGLSMIASLVKQPSFRQESIDKAIAALSHSRSDFWSAAINPQPFDLSKASHDEVLSVFGRVFRQAKMTVACGGPVATDDLAAGWASRTADWQPTPDPQFPDDTIAKPSDTNDSGITVAAFKSAEFPASDSALSTKLLAICALGCGKGSSLFRIAREGHAWSYRQEAYLWPTRAGFQPTMFLAMLPNPENEKRMADLPHELSADVAAWTDADRLRALGMAEAAFLRDVPYGPVLLGNRPVQPGIVDDVSMAAYWRMKTGVEWDAGKVLDEMKTVDLATLKAAAAEIITSAKLQLQPGKQP